MRTSKPTDDPNIQIVMIATCDIIRNEIRDKADFPRLNVVRSGVDKFLLRLPDGTLEEHKKAEKRQQAEDFVRAIIELIYYFRFKKPMPTI